MKGQTNKRILRHKLQRRLRNRMLVVEVDGGQHGANPENDKARTARLTRAGFRVLRFWDNEVLKDLEAVKSSIWEALHTPPPSQPSP